MENEIQIHFHLLGFVMLRARSAKINARRVENRAVGPRTMVHILLDPYWSVLIESRCSNTVSCVMLVLKPFPARICPEQGFMKWMHCAGSSWSRVKYLDRISFRLQNIGLIHVVASHVSRTIKHIQTTIQSVRHPLTLVCGHFREHETQIDNEMSELKQKNGKPSGISHVEGIWSTIILGFGVLKLHFAVNSFCAQKNGILVLQIYTFNSHETQIDNEISEIKQSNVKPFEISFVEGICSTILFGFGCFLLQLGPRSLEILPDRK